VLNQSPVHLLGVVPLMVRRLHYYRSPTLLILCMGRLPARAVRGTTEAHASSGADLYRYGMTTDLTEQDIIMGRSEKRLFHAIKQAVDDYAPPAVFVYNTCVPALVMI